MMRLKKLPGRQMLIVGAVVAVLVLVIAVLGWKYYELKKDPSSSSKAEIARIVTQVGKIYDLPTDEEPTVAKVQDKAQLAKQAFYSKAKNGDYVLVYAKNKVALIYRESENKLVNVGPVNFVDGQNQNVSGAQTANPVVAFVNASGSNDKLSAASGKLADLSSQANLSTSTTTAQKTLDKTVVVDVTGQNTALTQSIAQKLGATVETSMPNRESIPPGANIVVVVGKN